MNHRFLEWSGYSRYKIDATDISFPNILESNTNPEWFDVTSFDTDRNSTLHLTDISENADSIDNSGWYTKMKRISSSKTKNLLPYKR